MKQLLNKCAAPALCAALVPVSVFGLWPNVVVAQTPNVAVRGLPDFTDLVEQVGPSVVNIRTMEKVRQPEAGNGGPDDEM